MKRRVRYGEEGSVWRGGFGMERRVRYGEEGSRNESSLPSIVLIQCNLAVFPFVDRRISMRALVIHTQG